MILKPKRNIFCGGLEVLCSTLSVKWKPQRELDPIWRTIYVFYICSLLKLRRSLQFVY